MLAAWSRDPRAFDEDLEAFVDNFMKPGNLRGGFNWYLSVQPWRLRGNRRHCAKTAATGRHSYPGTMGPSRPGVTGGLGRGTPQILPRYRNQLCRECRALCPP